MSLASILKDTILPYVKTIGNNWWLGFVGYFAPIGPLVLVMVCFIMTDFVIGCLASYKRVNAAGKRWCFYSDAAWRTIYKFGFCTTAVAGLYVIGNDVLGGDFGADRLPNILCAMVCFTELWSFCENAAYLSGSKLFLWLRQFTINKAKRWDEDVAKDMEDLIKK